MDQKLVLLNNLTNNGSNLNTSLYSTEPVSNSEPYHLNYQPFDQTVNLLLALFFVIASFSNLILILVFFRRPGIRNLSNKFVLNLLVTNLVSLWTILPLIFYDNFQYGETQSEETRAYTIFISSLIEGISTGLCTANVMSVVLIGVDQYFAVIEPLRYHTIIHRDAVFRLIGLGWCGSIICGVLGTLNSIFNSYTSLYPILFSLVIFLLPFLILCYIYLSIYWAAHENSLRTRTNCSSNLFTEPSHSDLRMSSDSILKDKLEDLRRNGNCSRRRSSLKRSQESLARRKNGKNEAEHKPLLIKDVCFKNKLRATQPKVSKRNELYPITSIEDIDTLIIDKKSSSTNLKEKSILVDDQLTMKIDKSRENNENTIVDEKRSSLLEVNGNSHSSLNNSNNNMKVSSLNRQLMSNTIFTSLSKYIADGKEMKDSVTSLDESSQGVLSSVENASSVISLSHDNTSLGSVLRKNASAMSLSSYNPSNASSISDITLFHYYQEPVVSYFLHDGMLSSYYCDKDLLASLNVKGGSPEEPTSSLKSKDRYVRISLGCYNGIENVHVCNAKSYLNSLGFETNANLTNKNNLCDKPSSNDASELFSVLAKPILNDNSCSSQEPHPACKISEINETSQKGISPNNKPISSSGDSQTTLHAIGASSNTSLRRVESGVPLQNSSYLTVDKCEEAETSHMLAADRTDGHDKHHVKPRIYKKHNVWDDKRKQFYENERRKSNDSKSSSADDSDAIHTEGHYYRNMQIFSPYPRDKNSDFLHRGGMKPFHHSSTRSSLKSTSSSLVNSLRHRISNASLFKYREESRAAKISISVIIMALFSWLPFTLLLLLRSSLLYNKNLQYDMYSSFAAEKVAILCLTLHYVLSPLLFAHRNKKIQKELKKMLKSTFCWWKNKDQEQRRLRNSFYDDYYINKKRLMALKEKQRIESQTKKMVNAGTMTSEDLLSSKPAGNNCEQNKEVNNNRREDPESVKIDIDPDTNKTEAKPENNFSFLNKLLEMKLKYCQGSKARNNTFTKPNLAVDTQRSSISSNTVSTSTTDVCEV